MRIRRPKVIVHNFRPFPLTDEDKKHDAAVSEYPPELVILTAGDLCGRNLRRDDPDARWLLRRKAALLRRIKREKLVPKAS